MSKMSKDAWDRHAMVGANLASLASPGMRLGEACALAQEIQFDERAPWRVNKIEQWGSLTFAVNVSVLGQPTAGWWFRCREEWVTVRDSVK